MEIGVIGTGQIGATLIRQYAKAGHKIKMTNATGISKLSMLEAETGARAMTLRDTLNNVQVLVISIPFCEVPGLAKQLGDGIPEDTIIIDTTNYYPIRDGHIAEVALGMPESIWVSGHLSRPVIKAYNSILAGSLAMEGCAPGTADRLALPVSGDHKPSKDIVASLINDSGFDAIDIGALSDSWKQQPGSPVYCTDLTASAIRKNLESMQRDSFAERRELALQFILKQAPGDWLRWYKACVSNNRKVYETFLNH